MKQYEPHQARANDRKPKVRRGAERRCSQILWNGEPRTRIFKELRVRKVRKVPKGPSDELEENERVLTRKKSGRVLRERHI